MGVALFSKQVLMRGSLCINEPRIHVRGVTTPVKQNLVTLLCHLGDDRGQDVTKFFCRLQ